jgi:hypothetical protein
MTLQNIKRMHGIGIILAMIGSLQVSGMTFIADLTPSFTISAHLWLINKQVNFIAMVTIFRLIESSEVLGLFFF